MLKKHSILDRFKINLLFPIHKPVLPGVSQGVVNDNAVLPYIMVFSWGSGHSSYLRVCVKEFEKIDASHSSWHTLLWIKFNRVSRTELFNFFVLLISRSLSPSLSDAHYLTQGPLTTSFKWYLQFSKGDVIVDRDEGNQTVDLQISQAISGAGITAVSKWETRTP